MTDEQHISWSRIEITPNHDQWTIYAETKAASFSRTEEGAIGWIRPLGDHAQGGRVEGYRAVSNGYGHTTDRKDSPIAAADALVEYINRVGYWLIQAYESEKELRSLADDAQSRADDVISDLKEMEGEEGMDYWNIDSNIEELEDLARQMKEKANEAATYRDKADR